MALPTGSFSGTADISNLVKAAYDQYVRMALRSIPVMRALADVKPVQQAMPGSSVVFSIYSDLSAATSTLTETLDVSSIALGNPSQVTVTLNEYGSAVTTTKKLNLTSFNDVDAALADIIAYNAADSIDSVVTDNVSKTIIPGSVGVIEGAFVVETPRVPFAANTNSPAVNVYKAVVAGREALAEAMGQDINTVIGPEIDALRRFRTIGWYYFGGFARLREAALYRIETSASAG